ncbi:uncharacterized protein LOC119609579 [Lucilia sericata]|uniref:uncharacterized protein LOC119609579 n=1 Tax=Lucilia sericata TaxID=13632 RepID=UPI0018A87ABE|nr:uncharacterized protein LOC119609579 [Lucilia sericata]
MKSIITFLQIISIFVCCNCQSAGQLENKRKWLEIDNNLYRIVTEDKYTWKQAETACLKEHLNLITPKSDYDYVKLKEALKREIRTDSSFWINTKEEMKNIMQFMGLDKEQKCNKIDSTTFKAEIHDCQDRLGFICQRSFLKDFSTFNDGKKIYLVQPHQKFSCKQAFSECEQRHMHLLHFNKYTNNILLKDYIFLNYNSNISFHLSGTDNNCESLPHDKNKHNMGYICEQLYIRNSGVIMRHWILIIFVSSLFILAITFKIIQIFLCNRNVKQFNYESFKE